MSKRHRQYEDEPRAKRTKLDNLFGNLRLDDRDFKINPQVSNYSIFKKPQAPTNGVHNLNSYIVDKLVSHFNQTTIAKFQLLKGYNPKALVAYRFQKWSVKMFNRFIRKYNQRNKATVLTVRSYERMLQLAEENGVSGDELLNIILQENEVELSRLKNIKETEEVQRMGYNYWDTIHFDKDTEMSMPFVPRLVELKDEDNDGFVTPTFVTSPEQDSDSDMEIDEYTRESNYGSYYSDP